LNIIRLDDIQRKPLKVRRFANVCRSFLPFKGGAFGNRKLAPEFVPIKYSGVLFFKILPFDMLIDQSFNFGSSWPDIFQVYRLAVCILTERFGGQINIDAAGDAKKLPRTC
jgi:hypothetical protein